MMTQTFQDIIGHEPFHWRGDRNGIEEFNGAFESINGDDEQLSADEMQKFKAMVATITFPPNPFRNKDNTLPEAIDLTNHYTSGRFSPAGQPLGIGDPQNGLELFNVGLLDNVFQCGSCHTIPTGMAVNGPLMLGAINAAVGGEIMTMGPMDANHLGIVSVDGSTQKAIKTPQLRNMYEKVGFEMSREQSLTGFGFLHDGAIDSVARFLSAGAFSVQSDQEVADLVSLMMAFSGSELDNGNIPLGNTPDESQDTHAGVGMQYTLIQATQLNNEIDEIISISSAGRVDLIVKSANANYLYMPDTDVFIDEQGVKINALGLMAIADENNHLTYSIVPLGLGQRLAFDRDGDGVFDYQEIINGSNPTDENSISLKPATGLWFNSQRSGHGVDIQLAGDNMFIIWYTYNDDNTPTWYLASNTYNENWQADLMSFTWDNETRTATGTVVGQVNFDFTDAKNAQFSWNINGRESAESFTYFNGLNQKTNKQFTGTYYDVTDSGWGLSVMTIGQAQVAVVYYYDENGQPRWSLGSGDNSQNSVIEMLSFEGFCPDCEYDLPTNEVIGSVTMDFDASRGINFSTQLSYPDNSNEFWDISATTLTALSSELFDPEVQ
jgi:mono/diheme cytochrome c family protein